MLRAAASMLIIISTPATSQPQSSIPPAWPAPKVIPHAIAPIPLSSLDPLIGDWKGSGKMVRTGAFVGSVTSFQKRIGGDALFVVHRENAPNTYEYNALISFDSVSGNLVMLMVSNNGNGARVLRSTGWRDNRIVFQGEQSLRAWWAEERITFLRQDPDELTATYEMSTDNGATWRVGDVQVYKRAATSS